MDLVAYVVTFIMFWKTSLGLQCYTCSPDRSSVTPSCYYFNYSTKYVTECPVSTMCYKRITTMEFDNRKTEIIERGCAAQTMDGYQEKINGKWRKVDRINEVYEEKCTVDSNAQRITETVNCYCRGDLCNHANPRHTTKLGIFFICLAVLII